MRRQSDKTVHLSPAACKSLNQVAAQLWIVAYNQKYEAKHGSAPPEGIESAQHLTQV